MEASAVATPEAPPEPVPAHDGEAEATRSTAELFEWSGYVHVGTGAEDCEHGADGACAESMRPRPDGGMDGHFHAWVCLPNTFQIRDIIDKARAAKARKERALRDPESDSYAVLEAELDLIVRDHYDELLEALAKTAVEKSLPDIVRELQDDERFKHHAQDAEELRRLLGMPEDEVDREELERLQADVTAYGDQMRTVLDEREAREHERLRGLPVEDVTELERRARIENISTEFYMHTYYTWAMYVGTRKPVSDGFPSVRSFKDPIELKNCSPEVALALREKISTLENRTMQRGDAAGN